jgi:hypothetical protein
MPVPPRRAAAAALAFLLHAAALLHGAAARADPVPVPAPSSCTEAAAQAEREAGLPSGLLLAIGRVESGRPDPATGTVVPWPWTTNSAGVGHFFATEADALDWLRDAQMRGVQSIDVGCFQVNLFFHPDAFAGPEDAFDPLSNARYAAGFLAQLRARSGGWDSAVALYHSAVPELGGPYRDQVLARWNGGDLAAARPQPSDPYVVLVSVRAAAASVPQVWTPGAAPHAAAAEPGRAAGVPAVRTISAVRVVGGAGHLPRVIVPGAR